MAEWPDWNPPEEMIVRQPYLPRFMAGGETNPLGARALYLGKTVYRIHGTNQPSTTLMQCLEHGMKMPFVRCRNTGNENRHLSPSASVQCCRQAE